MKFYIKSLEDDNRDIYITGNFNKWNPYDKSYQLRKNKVSYSIEIPDEDLPSIVEYKFTKGGWENVELDRFGNITPNRKAIKTQKITRDVVEMWRLNWGPFKKQFFPVVTLISENFYIPQLDRFRKVWILLPYDYYQSEKEYPVLYLQDAQNLFNEGSPFGNWEIDKKLSILAEYGRGDVIVVAIDHGEESRISEYIFNNPKVIQQFHDGSKEDLEEFTYNSEGKKYIRFITDTLKPYIDTHFRTKREREYTGIGGSSLGGLISIYSGFLYPEVYSKLMIFSPSLWVNPNNDFPMINFRTPFKTKVYLYGGGQEGSQLLGRIRMFEDNMKQWERDHFFEFDVKTSVNEEGTHNEFFWSQEFPKAIEWLYYDNIENPTEVPPRLNGLASYNYIQE